MMPCCQHMGNFSPTCKQCVPRRNGFHKKPDKTEEDSPTSEKSIVGCFLFVDSKSGQDLERFRCEGEKLIKDLDKDPKNLEAVSKFVQNHKDDISVTWKNSKYSLQICDLSGTDYMGQKYMQESWEELYLCNIKMQVFGTLKYTRPTLTSVPWVILVGEDGCIYAYGDEELQLIAKSLQEFVEDGKKTVYKSYNYPGCSDEDDEQDEEIQKIRQRGKDFVDKSAPKFDDFLSYFSTLS